MRSILVALAVAVAACATPRAPAAEDRANERRLVVVVVIDQLPSWAFEGRIPFLKGGLARLLREGVYYRQAVFPYAATFTAVGHAALATGAPSSVTGILANDWWDREEGRKIEAVEDPAAPLLAVNGTPGTRGISPRFLRVEAVGDVLRRAIPRALVVSVSFKDRSAVLLGGRRPDIAVWYDPKQTAFTTSRYYAAEPPPWLRALAAHQRIAARLDLVWTPLDEATVRRMSGVPDDAPGEADSYGMGIAFPHALAHASAPAEDVEATPLADELVLEAALAALQGEGLGRDATPDLFLVSFSAHDYVAHVYGQESWETADVFLRLDDVLGRLLDELDRRVGVGRYAVVLTSDHGATRTIEQSQARGRRALRVNPHDIGEVAEAAAARVVGPGDWIAWSRDPAIYLTPAARALPEDRRSALLDAVTGAVGRVDGIGYARRSDALAGACDRRAALEAVLCRSIDPERSGEVYYGPSADSVIMRPPDEATSHGSANPDDRTVPLVIVAPGLAPGRVIDEVSALRVAPTVARLLGVPPPPAAREPPL